MQPTCSSTSSFGPAPAWCDPGISKCRGVGGWKTLRKQLESLAFGLDRCEVLWGFLPGSSGRHKPGALSRLSPASACICSGTL